MDVSGLTSGVTAVAENHSVIPRNSATETTASMRQGAEEEDMGTS